MGRSWYESRPYHFASLSPISSTTHSPAGSRQASAHEQHITWHSCEWCTDHRIQKEWNSQNKIELHLRSERRSESSSWRSYADNSKQPHTHTRTHSLASHTDAPFKRKQQQNIKTESSALGKMKGMAGMAKTQQQKQTRIAISKSTTTTTTVKTTTPLCLSLTNSLADGLQKSSLNIQNKMKCPKVNVF